MMENMNEAFRYPSHITITKPSLKIYHCTLRVTEMHDISKVPSDEHYLADVESAQLDDFGIVGIISHPPNMSPLSAHSD